MIAPDGKLRVTDCLDDLGVKELSKVFSGKKASKFIEWFTNSPDSIDGKSKSKAYALYESNVLDLLEIGTITDCNKFIVIFLEVCMISPAK